MKNNHTWSTNMKVGEAIVDLLSGRIYRTLPIALKELVSNAWDADAENVQIFIHEDKKQIAIIDDGSGMNQDQLKNYVNIAISNKPSKSTSDKGRPIIGHYGIGVLSALPFCKNIRVQTTILGSEEINVLNISSNTWIDEEGHRKPTTGKELTVTFPGRTENDNRFTRQQGTTIILENIFPAEWKFITKPANPRKKDYMSLQGVDRIKWFLKQYSPIEYKKDDHVYYDFFRKINNYKSMNLFFNGEKLYRNAISNATELEKNEQVTICDGKVKFKYLIVTPLKTVEPEDLRGLQIRLRNVAIGLPTHFDLYKRSAKLYGRMKYLGGEIEIISGFEEQLSLDRENIINCPEWIEFSDYFKKKLENLASLIEKWAEAETNLSAYAIKSGVSVDKTDLGFLSQNAIRKSTKSKRASSATSQNELRDNAIKSLSKIGYKFKEIANDEIDELIEVDHEKKIVLVKETKSTFPIIEYKKIKIFEIEKSITKTKIAKMFDKNRISFNYDHPLFKSVKNKSVIKEIISILYYLVNNNDSEDFLDKFEQILYSYFEKK